MSIKSKMNRQRKLAQMTKERGAKITAKKSVLKTLREQVMQYASFITMWKGRLIAIVDQIKERKAFFIGKEDLEHKDNIIKLCDDILNTANTMLVQEVPVFMEDCINLRKKLGEIEVITSKVDQDLEVIELMDMFHTSRSKYDKVAVTMDRMINNLHVILADEPTVQKPNFTNSTTVDSTPAEEVKVVTPNGLETIMRMNGIPRNTDKVIDVPDEMAKKLVAEYKGEEPSTDAIVINESDNTQQ